MDKLEIENLLTSIERLKSNIKECNDILIVLREIQNNYASAVATPKQLLEQLQTAEYEWQKQVETLSSKENEIQIQLKALVDNVNDKYNDQDKKLSENIAAVMASVENSKENIFTDIIKQFSEQGKKIDTLIDNIQLRFEKFSIKQQDILDNIEGLIENCSEIVDKQEETLNTIKNNTQSIKKFTLLSTMLGGCATVFSLVVLIILLAL